jgi:CBS domain-containing protein
MPQSSAAVTVERARCVGEHETIADAARKMRARGVVALAVCGVDNYLSGLLTARDIVAHVEAVGKDPSDTRVGELTHGQPLTLDVGDSAAQALTLMVNNDVVSVPVTHAGGLVGIISHGDLISALGPERVSDFIAA